MTAAKRQIFREQVLPHTGGKIPEEAFRADRLALNRLNKDGIAVPDGILLDARRRDRHPALRHNSDLERSVVKVLVSPDGRFAPPEGRELPGRPPTVDSTYIIRPPIGSGSRPPQAVGRPLPGPPLQIPTALHAPGPVPAPQTLVQVPAAATQQRYRHPAQYAPAYAPADRYYAAQGLYFQNHEALYSNDAFRRVEALLARVNARTEREAAQRAAESAALAASAAAAAWPAPCLLGDPLCQVEAGCQRLGDALVCSQPQPQPQHPCWWSGHC